VQPLPVQAGESEQQTEDAAAKVADKNNPFSCDDPTAG
jgi:hypothetical protein